MTTARGLVHFPFLMYFFSVISVLLSYFCVTYKLSPYLFTRLPAIFFLNDFHCFTSRIVYMAREEVIFNPPKEKIKETHREKPR